jgi:hypothetical protein
MLTMWTSEVKRKGLSNSRICNGVCIAKPKHCTHELKFFGNDTFLFIFRIASSCLQLLIFIENQDYFYPRGPYNGNSQIASIQSALQIQSKERAYGYKYILKLEFYAIRCRCEGRVEEVGSLSGLP